MKLQKKFSREKYINFFNIVNLIESFLITGILNKDYVKQI